MIKQSARRWGAFRGAFRYEMQMQLRRPILWIVMLLCEVLILGLLSRYITVHDLFQYIHLEPPLLTIVMWTNIINYLLPAALGILVADRLLRDHRTGVQELLTTLPGSPTARLFGKFLGSTLGTLLPIFLFYSLGIVVILIGTHSWLVIPLSLLTFATIVLPGVLFVGACATALPALIWQPLFQFLFLGYWFWGNLYTPRNIPTISNTILTPVGGYMSEGFFGYTLFPVAHANFFSGCLSLLLLLTLTVLVILALGSYQKWQQQKQ
jgi:ABC-type transport system involved in multi-copper enzyme maturation permease subunit